MLDTKKHLSHICSDCIQSIAWFSSVYNRTHIFSMFQKRNKWIKNANKYLSITSGVSWNYWLSAVGTCARLIVQFGSLGADKNVNPLWRSKLLAYFRTCSNIVHTISYLYHLTCSLVNPNLSETHWWYNRYRKRHFFLHYVSHRECIIMLAEFAHSYSWKYS